MLAENEKLTLSMIRKGNCWDNACEPVIETFSAGTSMLRVLIAVCFELSTCPKRRPGTEISSLRASQNKLDQPSQPWHSRRMKISNIYEAKTKLSEIIAAVLKGEKWAIARNGEALVMLVPIPKKKKKVKLGAFKKKIRISDDFESPLSDEELTTWNRELFPKR